MNGSNLNARLNISWKLVIHCTFTSCVRATPGFVVHAKRLRKWMPLATMGYMCPPTCVRWIGMPLWPESILMGIRPCHLIYLSVDGYAWLLRSQSPSTYKIGRTPPLTSHSNMPSLPGEFQTLPARPPISFFPVENGRSQALFYILISLHVSYSNTSNDAMSSSFLIRSSTEQSKCVGFGLCHRMTLVARFGLELITIVCCSSRKKGSGRAAL
jgi:hypothetical protein